MEKANLGLMGLRNPWTDFDKTRNVYLSRGYDHTCTSMWRCDNVGGLSEHAICHILVSYYTFLFLFCFIFGSCQASTSGPILAIYTLYRRKTCFRTRMCLWGHRRRSSGAWGAKSPPPQISLHICECVLKATKQVIKKYKKDSRKHA